MPATALGFRAHSGWAVLIAVGAVRVVPNGMARLRVEMVDSQSPGGKQPYHMASELNLDAAEALINSAADSAKRLATAALRKFISQVSEQGGSIVGANVLAASGRSLTDLRAILRSHPAIHTAEGELFRTALLHACHQCGILASPIREKSLMDAAISELGLTEQQITKRLVEMGQELGRPWTQDEKLATLAAWLTLFRGSPLT